MPVSRNKSYWWSPAERLAENSYFRQRAQGWQAVATAPPKRAGGPSLRVDWPMCRAHGLCAEVLPEAVHLDEWGYPVVDKGVPLEGEVLDAARRAVQSCPTLALRIVQPPR